MQSAGNDHPCDVGGDACGETFCLAASGFCLVPPCSHVHCVVEPLLFLDCTSVLPSTMSHDTGMPQHAYPLTRVKCRCPIARKGKTQCGDDACELQDTLVWLAVSCQGTLTPCQSAPGRKPAHAISAGCKAVCVTGVSAQHVAVLFLVSCCSEESKPVQRCCEQMSLKKGTGGATGELLWREIDWVPGPSWGWLGAFGASL